MATEHNVDNTPLQLILGFIALIFDLTRRLIDNYDAMFKIMTLTMLFFAIIVNLDKAIKVIYGYVVRLCEIIKKKI
jgi:hypothetical protein